MDKRIEAYVKQIVSELDCSKEDKNDIAEEMKGHIYLLRNEYLAKGITNEEATQKALQDFGDENNIKEGLQNSIFPHYKLFRMGSWVLFGVYSFIILWALFFQRVIIQSMNGLPFSADFESSAWRFWMWHTAQNGWIGWGEEASTLESWSTNSNLVPFRQISEYIFNSQWFNTDIIIRNLVGSIIIFIPLGIFLPILFKNCRKVSSVVVATILSSFTIQFLQLVFQVGQFDVDKIILHTIGSLIGYLAIRFIWKISNFSRWNIFEKTVN